MNANRRNFFARVLAAVRALVEGEAGRRSEGTAQAQGEAARFIAVYDQYRKAPDVTRRRIYIETMQDILGNMNKVILDNRGGQGVVPYLPLPELKPGQSMPKAPAPAPAPATTGGQR